jgi:hypothetical protein
MRVASLPIKVGGGVIYVLIAIQFQLLTLVVLLPRTPSPLKPNIYWRVPFWYNCSGRER